MIVALGLISVALILLSVGFYQLMKQQGRLLLRLDEVEHALEHNASIEENPERRVLPSERPLSESRIERSGLPAGQPAPLFALPDLNGGTVSLAQYRGRRVLLVFSDPRCGPCDDVAPDLQRLHQKHANNGLTLLVVGRGSTEENRRKADQHGFGFPVVLQKQWELSRRYGIFATPAAFLIGEDGLIAKDVAIGPAAILALAGDAAKAHGGAR